MIFFIGYRESEFLEPKQRNREVAKLMVQETGEKNINFTVVCT